LARHRIRGNYCVNRLPKNPIHLELDREELLALLSYIALGLNFSAAYSGEGGFLSPHEIGLHLSYINADGAARLTAKLATAVAALEEERQHTDVS